MDQHLSAINDESSSAALTNNYSGHSIENTQNNEAAISLNEPPILVMTLHALLYCERLFYLDEIEEIRVADSAVYAGRRLHDDVAPLDEESPEKRSVEVESS